MFSPTDVHSRRLPQSLERRKLACIDATTRFPRASCFEKPKHSIPETWECMHDVLHSAYKLVSSDYAKILKVATKIRETCEKTFFTPPSPTKATNSIVSV
jgi:hypothetical protein